MARIELLFLMVSLIRFSSFTHKRNVKTIKEIRLDPKQNFIEVTAFAPFICSVVIYA